MVGLRHEGWLLAFRIRGFSGHTRTTQARHVVRGLRSETDTEDSEFVGLEDSGYGYFFPPT